MAEKRRANRLTGIGSLLPIILDFEASSLGDNSYPIEVAWSMDGEAVEEHLISPASVGSWTDWSAKAEALHGISRDELISQGKNPRWLCERIREELGGKTVYSDNPDYDREWMRRLYHGCRRSEPDIDWRNYFDLPGIRNLSREHLARLEGEARALVGPAHRAGPDVRHRILLLRLARRETEANEE